MSHLNFIKALDNKVSEERLEIIIERLEELDVPYGKQKYNSGTNLIVDLGAAKKRVGVASHFDRVTGTAGANDNGSAIAVCLSIIEKFRKLKDERLGIRVFFFDEEETGLKGSNAYVSERGTKDLAGLINMELVGLGDKLACWPVSSDANSILLTTLEETAMQQGVATKRFDRIITNTADHLPFRKAGMLDAFTITCISDEDIRVSEHYFRALEFEVEKDTLIEILSQAPIFKHYHRPTDTFDRLNEASIEMTSAVVWQTILNMFDKEGERG